MAKNIKKSLKYVIIVIGVLIMLPAILYPLLQAPVIQTYLVNRITGHLSEGINSTISVGKIEYRFFNKLAINDLLIKDQHNDTLLYTKEIIAGLRRFDLKQKKFRFGKIELVKPVVALITDSSGMMNLTWYLNMLRNPEDTTKKTQARFSVNQIDLSDARFSFINHSGTRGKSRTDFNNLNVSSIYAIIEDLKIENDTTSFVVYNLGFKEASGFAIQRMSSSVTLAKQSIMVNSLFLTTDSSTLNISRLALSADTSGSFRNFATDVKIDAILDKSLLSSSDLQYFIPRAEEIHESVWLSGKIMGTVSELRGRNIILSYRNNTYLDCDFDLSGLPNIENTFIYIGVNNLKTNAVDIESFRIKGKSAFLVPEPVHKLGNISFNGSFTGFTTDFVTYGEIRTSQGNLRTDISLRPEKSKKYKIKGLLKGSEINLGELTGKQDFLGNLSFNTAVDGYAYSLKKFAANLTGKIDSIEVKKYLYRNIDLRGIFTEKTWDGSINISDNNIKMDLLGMFDFSNTLPEFDFTLNLAKANLYNLNFDRKDTTSAASMLLTANFKGNSIDNIDGEIKLLNSNFVKYGHNLELYDFSIKTFKDNNVPVLSLHTDFADAEIKGHYNFAALGELVRSTVSILMPSGFQRPLLKSELKKNNFTYNINFKNTDNINSFFRTGVSLSDKSYIKGSVSQDSIIKLEAKAGSLNLRNNIFRNLTLDLRIAGSAMTVDLKSESLTLFKQSELKDITIGLKTKPDNFTFTIDWDNKDKIMNRGNFIARGVVNKSARPGKSVLTVNIDSTVIYTRNNLWQISNSSVTVDSNAIAINNFYVRNNDHYYRINGTVSENPSDTLNLEFRGIDISPLNFIGNQGAVIDPDKLNYDFKGLINGKLLLTNVYKNLLLETDIKVIGFSLLGNPFGTMSINSELDRAKKVVIIKASNDLAGTKMLDITGYYDPATKRANLTGQVTKLTINFLNPLLRVFASGITGTASGKVNFTIDQDNRILTGAVMAENATMKINYLQTKYKMSDSVRFDKKGIKFNNVKITDEKGNPITLSGRVNHQNFKDFAADLTINAHECLVLNTKPKDNTLFYGTAYASGVTTIKSGNNTLAFDISARSGKNTKFYMPLNSGLSVSENSFVSFVKPTALKTGDDDSDDGKIKTPPVPTGFDLNFDLEVTPDAEAQLIFDSKVGDVMKGHGSGNLNITYNPKGEFRITGDYIVEDGDYLFTLGNILNKSFSVENGGKIMFNGDINNAEIDMKAIYKLRASLYPILQDENYKDRVPVECQLNLSGNLWNPVVGFNIYLPTADEKTRTYVHNAISTDEELSRQFLYLLVMNSFFADPNGGLSAGASSSASGTSAMTVTTFEMLSNQLNNWLSQISNDFDIGVVYRPGSGNKDINPQEVQVALSTQILNDKVLINGNFDVPLSGSSADNTNQITGDFDAEVKLTNKLNFKVFNRYNNPYTGKGVDYTQGIGIFFKQDFDKFSDLFRKKEKTVKDTTRAATPKN